MLSDNGKKIELALSEAMPPVFQNVMKLTRLGGQLSRPFFQSYSQNYSLTLNEWRAIVVLHARPGTAAQDVSRYTGVHPMNVSRAIKTLKKDGRVASAPDEQNHRRKLLTLTPKGEELFETLYPSSEDQAVRLFSALTPAEQALFGELLDRLLVQAELIMNLDDDAESSEEDTEVTVESQ